MDAPRRRRRSDAILALVALAAGLVACGGDDPTDPPIESDLVGRYTPTEMRFDPQGSAPEGNVLPLLDLEEPRLEISETGVFQLSFVDPVTNLTRTPGGIVSRTPQGLELVFSSQAAADGFLLPQKLDLDWDATARTLSYVGAAEVSRARLLQLFPELYVDEQFFDPTPGTLTVVFTKRNDTTS